MLRRVSLLAAAIASVCGCIETDNVEHPAAGNAEAVVMAYNVASGGSEAQRDTIAGLVDASAPSLITLSECPDCTWLSDRLPGYAFLPSTSDVVLAYDREVWRVVENGAFVLGVNDDGWGTRSTEWALFERLDTGAGIYLYGTHWCVTLRRDDDACDVARQLAYTATTVEKLNGRRFPDVPAILAGDLNVFDGFAGGPVLAAFADAGLEDTVRTG